jgi:hypothetical protein
VNAKAWAYVALTLVDMATYHARVSRGRGVSVLSKPVLTAALAFLSCAAIGAVAFAVTPVGAEFRVSTFTVANQTRPQAAMSSTGSFVVVWSSDGQDNLPDYSFSGVFGQRYDSAGTRIASEFQVNSYTAGNQRYASVSSNAAERFVVVWQSDGQDGHLGGVFAQLFDSVGARQGAEFMVNTFTFDTQGAPDVAMGPGGGFIVVWNSHGQDGDDFGIFGRRHNGSGIPQATEFQINSYTTGKQMGPSILITVPSELIVVWRSFQDGQSYGVFGRRVNQSGPQGAEFQINAYTPDAQTLSALAAAPDGGFVVVWQSTHDGAPAGIFGRRFDSVGAPLTTEFQVNEFTVGSQVEADLASNGTDFIAVWQSAGEDGDDDGVFAREIDLSGTVGAEFQINTHTAFGQRSPSVGTETSGDFVVAWSSFAQDGNADGVFARRFSLLELVTLDVDGDGTTAALTDGLLTLRFLFGFTGATLISNAVDPDCTRCDAADIVTYLTGLGLVLDIDDDGELTALTDGLLVLRFLFGFTGATLTTGAVDGDCMRCDAATIEPYLQGLL